MTDDNTTKTPIRADVPLDFHPDVLRSQHGDALIGGDGPAILALGTTALSKLYGTMGAMKDAHRAAVAAAPSGRQNAHGQGEGNTRFVGTGFAVIPAKEDQLREAMQLAFDRTTPVLTAAINGLQARKEKLEKVIAAALEKPDEKARLLAPQVRGHVSHLPSGERSVFLMKQIKAGDLLTLSAVLSAPAYLSGLSPEQFALVRASAIREFQPTAGEQLAALDKISAHLERCGTSFAAHTAKLMPKPNKAKAAVADAISALAAG